MSKLVREHTAQTFEDVYLGGYDKKYPSVDLVRLESWYFGRTPGKSLDYGCGPGTNGLHLLDSGYQVLFTDVSRNALKLVEQKLATRPKAVSDRATVRPIDFSADTLPDADNTYDYIVAMSVLGNLESADSVAHLLKEFFRAMKPGAKLIADINGEASTYVHDASQQVAKQTYKTVPRKGFDSDEIVMYFVKSADEFAELVASGGFEIEDIGFSAFKYSGYDSYEYIVCARKP